MLQYFWGRGQKQSVGRCVKEVQVKKLPGSGSVKNGERLLAGDSVICDFLGFFREYLKAVIELGVAGLGIV